jgi:UDP-glucose 4-epimerase
MSRSSGRRVLVTGAAGFVGIPVTRRLLGRGYEVAALDNFSVGSRERLEAALAGGSGRVIEADLRNASDVQRAVADARPWGIIHLAALHFIPYCVAHPAEALAVNGTGTQHLLDALETTDARRLVFASTADVYEPSEEPHDELDKVGPINVYGATKLLGEQLVGFHRTRQPDLASVVARMFNVYGPGETNPHVLPAIFEQLRTSNVLSLGNMKPRRDYIFVEDMADALVGLLESAPAGATVNVGPGRSWSVEELVRILERLLDRQIVVETDPARVRRSDRPRLEARNERLRSILPEFEPSPLEAGLAATLRELGLINRAPAGV